jgi:hypothetical protein
LLLAPHGYSPAKKLNRDIALIRRNNNETQFWQTQGRRRRGVVVAVTYALKNATVIIALPHQIAMGIQTFENHLHSYSYVL